MDLQNLAYALTQVAHNFGAVTVVAAPVYAVMRGVETNARALLITTLVGWGLQIMSGILFGLVSLFYYGQLPDISGIAIKALIVKVACAVLASIVVILSLRWNTFSTKRTRILKWWLLTALGCVALTAAAFLRWYS